jgi:beta-lactamase class A
VIAPVALPASPAVVQPAAYEASFGLVTGTVAPGTVRIRIRADGRLLADRPLRSRRFSLRVDLPSRDVVVRVTSVGARGVRRTTSVGPVFGLPSAARPRAVAPRRDPALQRTVTSLARRFGRVSGIYVQSLTSGGGAAWNAKARFPAASTLKLAIAVAVLRAHDGLPPPGSRVDSLLHVMLVRSDNAAANELEAWLGGSTGAGSRVVEATLAAIGIRDSVMFGGYETSPLALAPIPVRVERQPAFGIGKYTTAADLARLARSVWLASGGLGPLPRTFPGAFTPADARYLLRLLALVRDPGKLSRFLPRSDVVLHKAGWLSTARHDSGLVLWKGGALVAAVMTWSPSGVGTPSDVLAGRVARAARDRFAG